MSTEEAEIHLGSDAKQKILSTELASVLNELDQSFTKVIGHVEEQLFELAEASTNQRDRQVLMDAYLLLKKKHQEIALRFKTSFRNLLDESVEGKAPVSSEPSPSNWADLKLVDTAEIEEDVQVKRLSDKIKSSVEWELRDLTARMGYLMDRDEADEASNPLRPELFCRALGKACSDLEADFQTRMQIMRGFESAMSSSIGAVYQGLNKRLISHQVLPKIRHNSPARRTTPPPRRPVAKTQQQMDEEALADINAAAAAGMAAARGAGVAQGSASNKSSPSPDSQRIESAVSHVVESTLSMFEALQRLVERSPAYRGKMGANQENGPALVGQSRRNLMSAIQELREAHAVALDLPSLDTMTSDPNSMPRGPVAMENFIWANHDTLTAAAGDQVDRMKVDIVAMLFDQILADDKLPNDIKMLLARLQLPVLRIALADGSFFATRAHPTRRLIDRIASCAVGYEREGDANKRFFTEIERIVSTALRDVDEDSTLYGRLLEEFEHFLDRERSQANDIVGRAADVLERVETREVLSINATIQINQLLYGVALDPYLKAFLLDVWTHVLVEAACRCENSRIDPTVIRYKQLCVDLVWSAQPKNTPEERKTLVLLLPKMIACIREGLALIGYPQDSETRFFATLMQIHSNAVRTALGDTVSSDNIDQFARRLNDMVVQQDPSAVALPKEPIRVSEHAAQRAAIEAGVPLRMMAPPAAPQPTTAPRPVQRPAVSGSMQGATSGNTVPGSQRAAASATITSPGAGLSAPTQPHFEHTQPLESARPLEDNGVVSVWIDSLERGNWFEMKIDGKFQRVRLSWISPLKSFYLFTAKADKRAHSLAPDTLRAMLRCGDLRFIEDETLVDRAVRSVMNHLERGNKQ